MRRTKQSLKNAGESAGFLPNQRKYIGIFFECCSVYTRIYINREKTSYLGWCPKCARRIEIKIDKKGTDNRFFKVTRS